MIDTSKIKRRSIDLGADLIGIADLSLVQGIATRPSNLLNPYNRAIVIAVAIPLDVFEGIQDEPTPMYVHHYQTTNGLLDTIAIHLQNELIHEGYKALAIPASLTVDHENSMGHISHKALARAAGMGWIGKNLLLITPKYGSRVRLVTVLTNASLETDHPIQNRCGKCQKCLQACPVGAIKGNTWYDYPTSRDDALFFNKCLEKLKLDFAKRPGVGKGVCGICIKACPWGNTY